MYSKDFFREGRGNKLENDLYKAALSTNTRSETFQIPTWVTNLGIVKLRYGFVINAIWSL